MAGQDASHIFIVGDLFDFWYEYKKYIPKIYFSVLYKLKSLVNRGIEIHFLAGNHDFFLGRFFDKELGVTTWQDAYEFTLNNKKFYIWHGDGLGKNDVGYRILKKIMRNKINQKMFSWIHPDLGFKIARVLSGSSRKFTNQMNHQRDESDYFRFAEKLFDKGTDFVLMGHRHNPLVHSVGQKKYINLGDWIKYYTYAVFDDEDLQLRYFEKEKDVS